MKIHEPAFPINYDNGDGTVCPYVGLTKLEYACIQLRVPESGDDELDALINEARCFDAHGMDTEAWEKVVEIQNEIMALKLKGC